jgi:hypothetical protein
MLHCIRLAIAAAWVIAATPAETACRKYSIWRYPWAQQCAFTATAPAPPLHLTDDEDHSWYVEITKLPPGWSLDPDRADAIERLKPLMKGQPQ